MKHAFLIMAHADPTLLGVLLRMLDDERNDIFLHVDAKSALLREATFQTSRARLFILDNRVAVSWGDLSQIRAEYALFHAALAHGPYAYYHLLSGNDLPIKTQDEIHAFFRDHAGQEFVGFVDPVEAARDASRKMMRYWLLTRYARTRPKWVGQVTRRLNKYVAMALSLVCQREKMDFAKGANWVSITQTCMEYVVSQEPFVMRRFRHTYCSDEFFVQTLVWNHPALRAALFSTSDEYEGCMRLVDWRRGNPYVWTMADRDELSSSDKLFARKFSEQEMDIVSWVERTYSSPHPSI